MHFGDAVSNHRQPFMLGQVEEAAVKAGDPRLSFLCVGWMRQRVVELYWGVGRGEPGLVCVFM